MGLEDERGKPAERSRAVNFLYLVYGYGKLDDLVDRLRKPETIEWRNILGHTLLATGSAASLPHPPEILSTEEMIRIGPKTGYPSIDNRFPYHISSSTLFEGMNRSQVSTYFNDFRSQSPETKLVQVLPPTGGHRTRGWTLKASDVDFTLVIAGSAPFNTKFVVMSFNASQQEIDDLNSLVERYNLSVESRYSPRVAASA